MIHLLFATALSADPKIINGEDASSSDYPMTGGMLMDATADMGSWGSYEFRMLVCSSTLIAPDVVMLAAHCIDDDAFTYGQGELSDVEIRWTRYSDLSALDGSRRSPAWPEDSVVAWDWVAHPDFDLFGMDVGVANNADIALLFLDEPILDIEHAYLPSGDEGEQLAEGNEVVVVGWGQQIATDQNESPPSGSYAYKQIGTSWISELGETELKVGEAEDDVRKCHGDSGGPSFMDVESESDVAMRVVGVTSHAYDRSDCDKTGGVDTRVDAYLDWIDAEMRARCEDGTRSWCDEPGIVLAPIPVEEPAVVEGEEKRRFGACSTGGLAPTSLLVLLGLTALVRRRD